MWHRLLKIHLHPHHHKAPIGLHYTSSLLPRLHPLFPSLIPSSFIHPVVEYCLRSTTVDRQMGRLRDRWTWQTEVRTAFGMWERVTQPMRYCLCWSSKLRGVLQQFVWRGDRWTMISIWTLALLSEEFEFIYQVDRISPCVCAHGAAESVNFSLLVAF